MFKFLKEKLKSAVSKFSKDIEEEAEDIEEPVEPPKKKKIPKKEIPVEEEKEEAPEEIVEEKEEEPAEEVPEEKEEEVPEEPEEKEEPAEEEKEEEPAKEIPEEKEEEPVEEIPEEPKEEKKPEKPAPKEAKVSSEIEKLTNDLDMSIDHLTHPEQKKKKGFLSRLFHKKEEEPEVKETPEEKHIEEAPQEEPIEEAPKEETIEEAPKEEVKETPEPEEEVKEEPPEEKEEEKPESIEEEVMEKIEEVEQKLDKEEDVVLETEKEEEEIKETVEKKGFLKNIFKKKEEPIEETPAPVEETPEEETEEDKSFLGKLKEKVSAKKLSDSKFEDLFFELEVALLENNVAVEVIEKIKSDLKEQLVDKKLNRFEINSIIMKSLKKTLTEILDIDTFDLLEKAKEKKPLVIAFVGVNGSGKTTTIGKMAQYFLDNNLKPVMVAADTFRAAAIQQLEEHADNVGVKMIKHDYGSDPAAVAFDGIKYAKAKDLDVVLIDTAGRLHSDSNLMDEMKKIIRVAKPDLKIFIGESITGNDCVEQAKQFNDAVKIDGLVLSKADVDEKGGAAISVSYVTGRPILFLGTGQEYKDLEVFDKNMILSNLGL